MSQLITLVVWLWRCDIGFFRQHLHCQSGSVLLLRSTHLLLQSLIFPQDSVQSSSVSLGSVHGCPQRLQGPSGRSGLTHAVLWLPLICFSSDAASAGHTPSCLKAGVLNTHSKSHPKQILLQATMWNLHNFRQSN